jgi:hypothetical protein
MPSAKTRKERCHVYVIELHPWVLSKGRYAEALGNGAGRATQVRGICGLAELTVLLLQHRANPGSASG